MKIITYYLTIFFFCTFFFNSLQGQHDNQWIIGYTSSSGLGGGSLIDFQTTPITINYVDTDIRMSIAGTNICDTTGNLQFYSNGCAIYNHQHNAFEIEGYLNPGVGDYGYCDNLGSPFPQSLLTLPLPNSQDIYYLLHLNPEIIVAPTGDSWLYVTTELNYTSIEMSQNSGNGIVLEDSKNILKDTLASGYLQAVRHANGIFWWIIVPEFSSNCYYKLLLTPDGVKIIDKQCIGVKSNRFDLTGQVVFSPDGTKYARFQASLGLHLFDFDRCNGLLSNHINLEPSDEDAASTGVGISANSRFLYASFPKEVFQFDLTAEDIVASKVLIAEWDGFSDWNPTNFYLIQLAPNGKMYIGGTHINYHLHVIHEPDSAGVACNLVQHDLELPSRYFATLPNYPNFRLGASESPCDFELPTSTKESTSTSTVKIYPNPVQDYLTLELEKATLVENFTLYDALGKVVLTQKINGEEQLHMDISFLPKGLYFYYLKGGNSEESGKIVIE